MTTVYFSKNDDVIENKSGFNFLPILGILIILIFAGLGFSYFVSNQVLVATSEKYILTEAELTASEIRIIEIVSGHAWQKHGREAGEAFDCIGKKGTSKAFKTTGFIDNKGKNVPTNLWMCLDVNGNWYAVVTTIFQKVGENKVATLITCYKIAKDIFPTIDDYISYITLKWGAVAISYSINAEKIFLQPK